MAWVYLLSELLKEESATDACVRAGKALELQVMGCAIIDDDGVRITRVRRNALRRASEKASTTMDNIATNAKIALIMDAVGATADEAAGALDRNGGNVNDAMSQLCQDKVSRRSTGIASRTFMNDDVENLLVDTIPSEELRATARYQKAAAEFVVSLDETHETNMPHENPTAHSENAMTHENTASLGMADTLITQLQSTRMQMMCFVRRQVYGMLGMDENSERPTLESSLSSPTTRSQVGERVYPGAVAVPGPGARMDSNDEYSTTAPSSDAGLLVPVMARLVNNNEDDVQVIQEQLRAREEQLRQVLAERENAAVAQVIKS